MIERLVLCAQSANFLISANSPTPKPFSLLKLKTGMATPAALYNCSALNLK